MDPASISGPLLSAAPSKIQVLHVTGRGEKKGQKKKQRRKQLQSSVTGHTMYLSRAHGPRRGMRKPRWHHREGSKASCDAGQGQDLRPLLVGTGCCTIINEAALLWDVLAARAAWRKTAAQPHLSSCSHRLRRKPLQVHRPRRSAQRHPRWMSDTCGHLAGDSPCRLHQSCSARVTQQHPSPGRGARKARASAGQGKAPRQYLPSWESWRESRCHR